MRFIVCLILFTYNLDIQAQTCLSGDCFEGFGQGQWRNKNRYLGQWKDGKMQGRGVFYWPDGRKYIGEWQANKMHGRGSLYFPDGSFHSGYWENNRFVSRYQAFLPTGQLAWQEAQKQLAQMLHDRPKMQGIVPPNSPIYTWVLRKMAGEACQSPIHWQGQSSRYFSPPNNVRAAHRYPTAQHEALIWISPQIDGQQAWAALIFELFNVQNYQAFQQIENQALKGRCNRACYVRSFVQLEHQAGLKTAQFYRQVWKNNVKKEIGKPEDWYVYLPLNFEDWYKSLPQETQVYPNYPYQVFYDSLISRGISRY